MMRTTILMIGALLAAAPAAASAPAKHSAPASAQASAAGAKETKYCIQYDGYTGTRLGAKQECRTRAQWARDGIDVDKLLTD